MKNEMDVVDLCYHSLEISTNAEKIENVGEELSDVEHRAKKKEEAITDQDCLMGISVNINEHLFSECEHTRCEEEFLERNVGPNINETGKLDTNEEKRKYHDTSKEAEEETNCKKLKLDIENPPSLPTENLRIKNTYTENPSNFEFVETETQETSNGANADNYEKSVINGGLIEEALKNSLAALWDKTNKSCALVTVDEHSEEYKSVEDFFSKTSRGITIKKLERVENPFLLAHFLLRREKVCQEKGSVKERSLFHGTRKTYVDGICKYNFDWRRRGTSRGHKFGQGVSFAPEVSYARHYTFGDNVMIFAKVPVAKSSIGNLFTVVPPEPYDTTTNAAETVVVKYEDNEFLPQYVIHY